MLARPFRALPAAPRRTRRDAPALAALFLVLGLASSTSAQELECPGAIAGSLTAGDSHSSVRWFRDAVSGACGSRKACPGTISGGSFAYDAYTFRNWQPSSQCISVTLDGSGCGATQPVPEIMATVFSGVPTGLSCTGFITDPGNSTAGGSRTFGFTAAPGEVFTVLVGEVTAGSGCTSYSLQVTSCGAKLPPPTLVSVDPVRGPSAGGTFVTLLGTHFVPGQPVRVRFGGVLAPSATVVDAQTIWAFTPARTPGLVEVSIESFDGQSAALPAAFLFDAPPVLSAIDPVSGPTSGGATVHLVGSGFRDGARVRLGGAEATSVVVESAASIVATTPAHVPGAVDVEVVNDDGESSVLASAYTFLLPVPSIARLEPSGGALAGGTPVLVVGNHFLPGAAVRFDGLTATNVVVVDETTITAVTPPHSAGAVTVEVANTDGRVGSLANAYTYSPAPEIATIAPSSAHVEGGADVTITGSNFLPGTVVRFGGTEVTPDAVDPTRLHVIAPAHAPGVVDVEVVLPDDQFAVATQAFTYVEDGSGCNCRASGASGGSADLGWLVLVVLGLARMRRRVR